MDLRNLTANASVGIDIGGTFTDLVMVHPRSGERVIEKVLTTPEDPSRGVLSGLLRLLERSKVPVETVRLIAHATTLATNTIIEGKGAKIGLITTEGFRDILEIQTESRYDLYDLDLVLPPPLVPRDLRREVKERLDHHGEVVRALDPAEVRRLLQGFLDEGIRDLAVCLLHSYANPVHEQLIRKIAEEMRAGFRLSLSSEICPEIREYLRVSTTVINAYIRPQIITYMNQLETGLAHMGFKGNLFVMSSAGGVLHPDAAKDVPAALVESGPAAGVLAACYFGAMTERKQVIAFDMGGTTAKACLINNGEPARAREIEVARIKRFMRGSGYPIRLPVVELIEIGAGGGSIAWIDSLGLLKVGPEGAGAAPGPAAYGLGGERPTVTDADLVLGYLDPNYFLGGEMKLDVVRAEAAIRKHIAEPLGMSMLQAAWGIFDVVTENMAAAARTHAIERGLDPRAYSVIAFGGAGPVHAYRVAQRLGTGEVIYPVSAGVASAAGLLVSPAASHHVRTFIQRLDRLDRAALARVFDALEEEGKRSLQRLSLQRYTLEQLLEMRYVGQGFEVEVKLSAAPSECSIDDIRRAFEAEYVRLYGRVPGDLPIEIINCRASLSGFPQNIEICPPLGRSKRDAKKGSRRAYFAEAGDFVDAGVYARELLMPDEVIEGPAIIEEPECTIVVPPGQFCKTDRFGNLIMSRKGE
ncbi:MAG: hydantoinase/oxoprolinase family protein [Betaproteobacteria bacterium]|nr:hydantoinase/oxoprolinase family protein [Betaproteobacteria bacterium]